ncbi:MAG: HAMP domain-containing histidine kinase [Actinobacteria bacterium]|nr:HAMP domain-containing histidine kinase [Actinomycetota bacterium]
MTRCIDVVRRVRGSVRARVALTAAAVFAVTLVAGSIVLLRTVEDRLVDDVRDSAAEALEQRAVQVRSDDFLVSPASAALRVGDDTVVYQLPATGVQPVVLAIRTVDPGAGTGTGADAGATGLVPIVTSDPAVPGGGEFIDRVVGTGGASAGVAFPAAIDPQSASLLGVTGSGSVMVSTYRITDDLSLATASSLAEVDITLDTTRQVLWWAVPALVLLVGVLAWALAGRALRPVRDITSQVAIINRESLHERVPAPRSRDEVSELASTMNSMLDRLEQSSESNRRLVSDAAHELRTPIAVIRAEVEVARRTAEATDWPDVTHRVLGETERLQQLVDDLLLLSRLDERLPTSSVVSVDDLVRDVAGRRRRVDVELHELAPAVELDVDADATRRALDHVVANAARHAASAVEIGVAVTDGTSPAVAITVDDDGPGIPSAERDRVLERFVRLDEGRSRDGGGSGLGLAVVADVMAAHGGEVIIGDSPLGGARVTLVFPTERSRVLVPT